MKPNRIELLPEFLIKVEPTGITATIGQEMDEENIIAMLSFSEDRLCEILETHAAKQVYWEALAVRLKNKHKDFEDTWYKKWWSHNKIYARYVLAGFGDTKPTVDSIKDMVVSIYSEDSSDQERDKYLHMAYGVAIKKEIGIICSKEEFRSNMYKYVSSDPRWYFETMMRTLNKYNEDYEIVQAVAKNLYARSFHIEDVIDLVRPKSSNKEPMSVSEQDLMHSTSKFRRRK